MKRLITWWTRLTCRHRHLHAVASTGARKASSFLNVEIGITIHCQRCGKQWADDLLAGCPEAWGKHGALTS